MANTSLAGLKHFSTGYPNFAVPSLPLGERKIEEKLSAAGSSILVRMVALQPECRPTAGVATAACEAAASHMI